MNLSITEAVNEREEQTQQHGTLKQFVPASIFKKGRKIKIQEMRSCESKSDDQQDEQHHRKSLPFACH